MTLRQTARMAVHTVGATVLIAGCQSTFAGINDSAEHVVSGVVGRIILGDGDGGLIAVRIGQVEYSVGTTADSLNVMVGHDTKVYCGPLEGELKRCGTECFVPGALLKAQTTGVELRTGPATVSAMIVEVRLPS